MISDHLFVSSYYVKAVSCAHHLASSLLMTRVSEPRQKLMQGQMAESVCRLTLGLLVSV